MSKRHMQRRLSNPLIFSEFYGRAAKKKLPKKSKQRQACSIVGCSKNRLPYEGHGRPPIYCREHSKQQDRVGRGKTRRRKLKWKCATPGCSVIIKHRVGTVGQPRKYCKKCRP